MDEIYMMSTYVHVFKFDNFLCIVDSDSANLNHLFDSLIHIIQKSIMCLCLINVFMDLLCSSLKSNNTATSQSCPQNKETSTTIQQETCPNCGNSHMVKHHTCCEMCVDFFFDSPHEEICCCAKKKKKCRNCGHIKQIKSDCC